jgi:hypothetical protein
LQCARQAQDLSQQLGDQRGEIDASLKYCELAELAGEPANLRAQVEEALRMAEGISYIAGIAKARLVLGSIVYHAGEFETAIQYVLPSVALWRELDRPFDWQPHSTGLRAHYWKSTNMRQVNRHYSNAGISTNRSATGVA